MGWLDDVHPEPGEPLPPRRAPHSPQDAPERADAPEVECELEATQAAPVRRMVGAERGAGSVAS